MTYCALVGTGRFVSRLPFPENERAVHVLVTFSVEIVAVLLTVRFEVKTKFVKFALKP